MASSAHQKSFFYTSDFMALVVVTVGVVLEYFLPTAVVAANSIRFTITTFLLACGWLLLVVSKYQFREFQQPSKPGVVTTALVTKGIFSVYRNPMYQGVVLVVVAIGVGFDSWWVTSSSLVVLILLHYLLVIPEEQYLKEKFGRSYERYYQQTRRWL